SSPTRCPGSPGASNPGSPDGRSVPVLEALLKTLVSLGLVTAGATYVRGWRRLRASRYAPPRWRLALYVLGLATIAAAVLSPLDDLAARRFSAHMGQHLLLIMVAAPLLVLGNPLPLVLWGLPAGARRAVGKTLRRGAPLGAALSALTFLAVAGGPDASTVGGRDVPLASEYAPGPAPEEAVAGEQHSATAF